MCMMSMIIDYGRKVPSDAWDQGSWDRFTQVILPEVEKLDEELGEPDCVDPGKAEWMEQMEERMQKLEEEAKSRRPMYSLTDSLDLKGVR